jgi:hypothetical protein
MHILKCMLGGFALLRYCVSSAYRAETQERWAKTPTAKVVVEILSALIGVMLLAAGVAVIYDRLRQ